MSANFPDYVFVTANPDSNYDFSPDEQTFWTGGDTLQETIDKIEAEYNNSDLDEADTTYVYQLIRKINVKKVATVEHVGPTSPLPSITTKTDKKEVEI